MSTSMTGKELRARRTKLDLTQQQIAQLLHMSVSRTPGRGRQSIQIGKWENNLVRIPPVVSELLSAKLYLLEKGLVTYEELIQYPLHENLADIYS